MTDDWPEWHPDPQSDARPASPQIPDMAALMDQMIALREKLDAANAIIAATAERVVPSRGAFPANALRSR